MNVTIRPATDQDIPALYHAAEKLSAAVEDNYFEECLKRAGEEERDVYLAERNDIVVGYVMLVWKPRYIPFRNVNIPEIQDLNVVPSVRRQGIGAQLVKYCEDIVKKRGLPMIGIGVGLHSSYGPAQRLYISRGYVPDGGGAAYDSHTMSYGEMRPLDNNFTLKLVRDL